ncbi:hypothetical protein [Endozoicomonas sp.]|uniref:hypothetical protein n=1 Tax=Endozoicomonas sp. TaxID=1892382 RepID=UPI003AF890A9
MKYLIAFSIAFIMVCSSQASEVVMVVCTKLTNFDGSTYAMDKAFSVIDDTAHQKVKDKVISYEYMETNSHGAMIFEHNTTTFLAIDKEWNVTDIVERNGEVLTRTYTGCTGF